MKEHEYAVNEINLPKDFSWVSDEVVVVRQKNDVNIRASNTDDLCNLMFLGRHQDQAPDVVA